VSPTLLNRKEYGYDVRLYTKDHAPAHVHVFAGMKEAKISLDPIDLLDNWGFNPREISKILNLIEEQADFLLQEWDNYHPIH